MSSLPQQPVSDKSSTTGLKSSLATTVERLLTRRASDPLDPWDLLELLGILGQPGLGSRGLPALRVDPQDLLATRELLARPGLRETVARKDRRATPDQVAQQEQSVLKALQARLVLSALVLPGLRGDLLARADLQVSPGPLGPPGHLDQQETLVRLARRALQALLELDRLALPDQLDPTVDQLAQQASPAVQARLARVRADQLANKGHRVPKASRDLQDLVADQLVLQAQQAQRDQAAVGPHTN